MFRNIIRKLGLGKLLYELTDPRKKLISSELGNKLPKNLKLEQYETVELLACARRIWPQIQILWDVGACRGVWAVLAKSFFPQSRIYCFEPQEDLIAQLTQNMENYDGITIFNTALGNTESEQEFYQTDSRDCSSIFKPASKNKFYEVTQKLRVACTRAENVIASGKAPIPDLLKLDVQGYELEVLKGFGDQLKNIKFVICEVIFDDIYLSAPSHQKLLTYLFEQGFKITSFYSPFYPNNPLPQADFLFTNSNFKKS